jgi:hypothetical protein
MDKASSSTSRRWPLPGGYRSINPLRTDGDFYHVTKGGTEKLPQKNKIVDMTIHWKSLQEHILMVPLVFRFNHFWGKIIFLKKPQSLKSKGQQN